MNCQHCGREHPAGTPRCPATGNTMGEPGVVGTRVDRYQVERLLGAGGFGSVYRARHVHTDAIVALKLLKKSLGADQGMIERFLREAKAAAAIGDEHIVRVLDAGVATDGQPFLALEFLDGLDLKDLATREGPLQPMRLVQLTVQVLGALAVAHAQGIVHRDMKPANVFVVRRRDERGVERDFAKVLDFGISKMHGAGDAHGLTQTGVAMGTPAYMAPEQFFDARNVDGRADVYSVAVMLYELLTNRLPFDSDSYAGLIVKVRTEQPPLVQQLAPHVPMALAQAVMVGLAKEPAQRWMSALDFANALKSAMGMTGEGLGAALHTPAMQPLQLKVVPIAPPERPALSQFTPAQTGGPARFTPGPVSAPPPAFTPAPPSAPPQQLGTPHPPLVPAGAQVAPLAPPTQGGGMSPALKWTLIVVGTLLGLSLSCCLLLAAYGSTLPQTQ